MTSTADDRARQANSSTPETFQQPVRHLAFTKWVLVLCDHRLLIQLTIRATVSNGFVTFSASVLHSNAGKLYSKHWLHSQGPYCRLGKISSRSSSCCQHSLISGNLQLQRPMMVSGNNIPNCNVMSFVHCSALQVCQAAQDAAAAGCIRPCCCAAAPQRPPDAV
jgi:hypothetical protein